MEKQFVNINGIKTAYIEMGTGEETVLILHGWGTNIETMMAVVNILKDKYRVFAYDAPGFGESEDPPSTWGTQDYADFALAFMDFFQLERPHCIGHSFGGKTLTLVSGEHEDRVNKLILIDASGVAPKRPLSYYWKVYSFKTLRFLYKALFFWKDKDKVMETFYKKYGSDDYKASEGVMRKTFVKVVNENTDHIFPKIKAPTLLIWGENDEDTPLFMAKVFEEKIPDAGLVILKGGHYSYIDDYGTFKAVLQSFL
ncbi:MAG: alpha/beta hydrolase [Tissierellia bacterium]|nr:alpha/beta hydrolase [Tissierellia bacterium]